MTTYPRTRRRPPTDRRGRPLGAYIEWERATLHDTRLAVAEDDVAQAQARTLVRAGMVAYENRAGLIRDVGWAREDRDAGRVYSRRAPR